MTLEEVLATIEERRFSAKVRRSIPETKRAIDNVLDELIQKLKEES